MQVDIRPGFAGIIVEEANRTRFGGSGFLAGSLPDGDGAADGRARVLNVPARVDITVFEPVTFEVVARTLSRADGTWYIPFLNTGLQFTIVGTDRGKQVNSAIQDWIYPAPMDPE